MLKPGGHLVATFRPNTWTAADPYGYRAALTNNGQQWRLVEDKLADFHGPLQARIYAIILLTINALKQ